MKRTIISADAFLLMLHYWPRKLLHLCRRALALEYIRVTIMLVTTTESSSFLWLFRSEARVLTSVAVKMPSSVQILKYCDRMTAFSMGSLFVMDYSKKLIANYRSSAPSLYGPTSNCTKR